MLRAVQRLVGRASTVSSRSCHCHHYNPPRAPVTFAPWKLYPSSQPLLLRGMGISEEQKRILDFKVPMRPPPGQGGLGKEYESPSRGGIEGRVVEDPLVSWRSAIEEAPPGSSEGGGGVVEKQAARLIVIRRSKMNKHKLKKLRKKMKFVWAKVTQRREMRREREYLNSKMALIQAAQNFDAKEFVAGVIQKAKEKPIEWRWQDPIMPQWFKEQEMLKEIKGKRYQQLLDLHLNHKIKIDKN